MFDFKEKVALITGAARGIGLSLARELLKNGVKGVAVVDINAENGKLAVEQLAKEFSNERVIFIKTDITQRSEFEDAFDKTIKTFKGLHIVINNAAILQEKQWEEAIAVNLQGCVTGSLLALDKYFPKTLGNLEGIILNISSLGALCNFEYPSIYVTTKQAVVAFSRSISGLTRCPNAKIKVIVVCPGTTITEILTSTSEQVDKEMWKYTEQKMKTLPTQTVEELACKTVSIMSAAETGSVWVVSGNIGTKIEFPVLYSLP